jgi:hypothetical protein
MGRIFDNKSADPDHVMTELTLLRELNWKVFDRRVQLMQYNFHVWRNALMNFWSLAVLWIFGKELKTCCITLMHTEALAMMLKFQQASLGQKNL